MNEFKSGDQVKSLIFGLFYGMPGTVRGKAMIQYGGPVRYNVLLDNGQVINVRYWGIGRIERD